MKLLVSPPPPLFPSSPCRRSGKAILQKHFHAVATRESCKCGEANRTAICRVAETHGSEQVKGREPLRRGTVSPRLPVPEHIRRPPYDGTDHLPDVNPGRQMHDRESIVHMRAACELAARVLQYAGTMVKSVCTSVNECICHGIPDSRALRDGDIINIDVTIYLNGYHGDTSRTYLCGEVDEPTKQLVKVTKECMLRGISACKHGVSFKAIGERISEHVNKYGYSIDPFIGHGVGTIFHSEPIIWHTYDYEPGFMVAGQTFTIEPTLSMGSTRCEVWDDGWTAITVDGSLNAQFEHTVLVTVNGAEILTKC
ncbi:methionine aminopeptidase 1B, chloroplastic isoform X2 [Aegilops tauschii subsp. strangulata]|uniref:methionine aminopeptidase 1B, chloroplastic isoform X2 n=1 Tax=Aegilops tauschii subsp. strangulata TaxID=200361 RepID=UPI00098B4575|nr:methionine aminopeptidase 1B, chloroplastic isoform X2 [Aegilops tauschii subsp. strangulata]